MAERPGFFQDLSANRLDLTGKPLQSYEIPAHVLTGNAEEGV